MRRLKREKENLYFDKFRFLIRVLYLFVFVLVALQIIVSNSLISEGDKISKINKETEKLRFDNKTLEEAISKTNSLAVLTSLTKENGFVKANSVIVLSPTIPVAQGRIN